MDSSSRDPLTPARPLAALSPGAGGEGVTARASGSELPLPLAGEGGGEGLGEPPTRRWPRWLRRGPMELAACCVIALGFLMMLQPFAMTLYTWSFVTTLAGTLMFIIVSKFPQ